MQDFYSSWRAQLQKQKVIRGIKYPHDTTWVEFGDDLKREELLCETAQLLTMENSAAGLLSACKGEQQTHAPIIYHSIGTGSLPDLLSENSHSFPELIL